MSEENRFLEEVKEDLATAKYYQFVLKILPIVIIVTFITILIVSGFKWYNNRQILRNQQMGDVLQSSLALMSAPENEQVLADSFKYFEGSDHAVTELAHLYKLAYAQNFSDNSKIYEITENIIENKNYSNLVKSFVKIIYCNNQLNIKNTQDRNFDKVEQYLSELRGEHDHPFKDIVILYYVQLLLAQGDQVGAKNMLDAVQNEGPLSSDIQGYINILLHQ